MLEITDGYRSAIVGDVRQMFIRALVDLTDPDMILSGVQASGQSPWSKLGQVQNREMHSDANYFTLEPGRTLLDGTFRLMPENYALPGEVGFVGDALSGADGYFPGAVWMQQSFQNVSVLQACYIYFSDAVYDGTARDFTVTIYSNQQAVHTATYTDYTEPSVYVEKFTVYNPTSIRVDITRWSLPGRYARISEIVPGLYETWTEDMLASLDIQMRGNFAGLAIPYGTCTLRMDNLDRRFEPRRKDGVFQSIEERQGIDISLGVKQADGTRAYLKVGTFFHHSGGWTTGDNALTMQWDLVDIVGLLADRDFVAPAVLPTTLSGWIAALAAQLGESFANRWSVDPNYASASAVINTPEDIKGKKCGEILRFVCMATGTWPRADAATGYLTAEPLWSQGSKYDLDNMNTYPVIKANDDLSVLIFNLYETTEDEDGNPAYTTRTLVVSGNTTASDKTLTINNPFIHTETQARTAAKIILSQYGGNKLELTGRGDPASEIGDVDTVWLNEAVASTGRRMEQSFTFSNGVLRDCKSILLQADGSYLFEEYVLITQSGQWQAPAGKTRLRVIIGQGGQGGGKGGDGDIYREGVFGQSVGAKEGETGVDGAGGMIWSGTIDINDGQIFDVNIGAGGAPGTTVGAAGAEGGHTTFGVYTSAGGQLFPNGYTDIANGTTYGRTGVPGPRAGTSDGGRGGAGGAAGVGYLKAVPPYKWNEAHDNWRYELVVEQEGGEGEIGSYGASGFVLVWWDKEE